MKRKLIGMITAAAMLLSCMPYLTAAAEGETITTASNLKIYNEDGLKAFRDAVNNNNITYEGYTVSLENNITLTESNWTPIGVYGLNEQAKKPFKGTFNGKGHTISGLKIEGGYNAGLFGYVLSDTENSATPATIKNLTVEGSITPTGNAGGIVAYLEGKGSTVSCCHSEVNIAGSGVESSAVGGIVGHNASGIVTNCYSTGTVSAAYNVGGVVGWNAYGTVSYCHYYNSSSNCLSITSGKAIGAIIGENDGTITSCRYLSGTTENGIGNYTGVDAQTTEVQALSANDFKETSKFPNWDFQDTWEMGNNYPVLNPYVGFTNHITNIEQLEQLRDAVNAGAPIVNKYDTYYLDNDLVLSNTNWEPIGTSDNPFTKTFTGWDPNTNLEAVRTITGLKIFTTSGIQGLFGCNSGTIKNLTLSDCRVTGGGYVGGLVGQNNGTIQNVTVAGTVTGSGDNVGGIAGSTTASISGCTNNTRVTGKGNNVGGIVGYSNISSGDNSIADCINNAHVEGTVSGSGSTLSGSDSIGGIVGYNEKGTVTRCHTTAYSLVSDGINVGGIVGKNEGNVQLCYNSGTVGNKTNTGQGLNVGGVVGSNNINDAVIENCYNTADVSGYVLGGVLGINTGKIRNCYSNGTTSGGSYRGGVVGRSTGETTSCYFLHNENNQVYVVNNNYQGTIDSFSRRLETTEFTDETNFKDWDFNKNSIWTIDKSEGAPVFFDLKLTRDDGDIEIGYYTDANEKRHDDATAFVVTLTCGDVATRPYVSGSITVGEQSKTYEKQLATEISGKGSVNIGIVLTGIAADDAVLKAQAMIE